MSDEQKRSIREDLCDRVEPKAGISLLILDEGVGISYLGVRCSHRYFEKVCRHPSNNSGRCKYNVRDF